MYILSINLWFQKLIKQFFFSIDQIVYNGISSIYDLLISIARTSIFTQADILEMAERIYSLLAVFMVFKVTLSLITYAVNPDDFSDKNKGISKLSTNIIISLGLLILTPYIFNYAYKLQTIILEDNTLAVLIFGEENSKSNFINTAGDDMAYITMSAFFTPNTSITKLQNCIQLKDKTDEGYIFNKQCSGLDRNNDYKQDTSIKGGSLYDFTYEANNNDDDFELRLVDLQNYVVGVEKKSLGLMFREEIALATDGSDDENFIIDYKYIFSTVIGVVVVLLLVSFCMDVALRSIKLGFLQLIAPIPILSYVDPKSGKDGMFKKWYQLCFKTYLSLFIRLLALYFAVYIIGKVADLELVDTIDGSYQTNAFIYIFVIIGALMFAKDLPKILEGLGIKLDGDGKFFLNPLKKFEESTVGGKRISNLAKGAAVAGLAGGTAFATNLATTGSRFKNAKGFWGKTGSIFSSVGGGISGAVRGLKGGIKGEKFGKNFTNSYSGAMKAKHDKVMRNQLGVGAMERAGHKISSTFGNLSYGDRVKNEVGRIEAGSGDSHGFTSALQEKYGASYGETRSKELSSSKYFRKSNKELETDQKILKTKQEHIGAVMSGKDKIEGIVSKDRGNVKAKERNVKAIEARTDADYISGQYGNLLQRYEGYLTRSGKLDTYTDPKTSDEERNAILSELVGMARNEDRSVAKAELDKEIAKTIVSDLSDPNEKFAANKVFAELQAEVLSTEDQDLIDAFNNVVKIDDNGELKLTGTDEEKTKQMMDIIDAFGTGGSGVVRHTASRVNASIQSEASDISDILEGRSVQASKVQNSEEARHESDIASTFNSK